MLLMRPLNQLYQSPVGMFCTVERGHTHVLLLIGRPTMIMEPLYDDVFGVLAFVLAFVLGSLLTLRLAIKAEDKPKVCPRCGRVS